MKILITGASGFTGQHACEYFSKAGYEVTAVTRKSHVSSTNSRIEYCDLTDQDDVQNLIQKIKPQFLLHLAGQNHVGDSWENPLSSLKSNMMTTGYLIESIRMECHLCKIVVVGSALQFDLGNLKTLSHPYSLSKTLQVLLAQSWEHLYGMNIIVAKPSNIIGPGYSNGVCSIFANKIVQMEKGNEVEKVLEVNNLQVQRDFIDVRDVVKGYDVLFQKGLSGEIYDISSGKSTTLEEVIQHMRALTKVDFKVKTKNDSQDEQAFQINPIKMEKLGWNPTILLSTSIQDILEFHRKTFKKK